MLFIILRLFPLSGVNMYLTLQAFGESFAGSTRIVPIFGAVYGGYYLAMGAEFFRNDFDDPDVFAAKIAKQFTFGQYFRDIFSQFISSRAKRTHCLCVDAGAQMGWFSLGGRDNQNPQMGIFDLLMSDQYTQEIIYLQSLARYVTYIYLFFSTEFGCFIIYYKYYYYFVGLFHGFFDHSKFCFGIHSTGQRVLLING
jgi:hypothetical protein